MEQVSAIKGAVTLDDIFKGKMIEFEGAREEFDSELFDELDEDDPEPKEVRKNPWQCKFKDLLNSMSCVCPGVFKRVVKEGLKGSETPEVGVVKVHYNGYIEGSTTPFDSTYMRGVAKIFTLGNGEVLEGLEKAVRSMRVGEESEFVVSYELFFGEIGCPPRIPPRSDVLLVIQLLECSPIALPDTEEISTEFLRRFKDACVIDLTAKKHFSSGNFGLAIDHYKRAVHELEFAKTETSEEVEKYKAFLKRVFLNLMICYNREKKPHLTLQMVQKYRHLDGSDNAKVSYHEGRAYSILGEFKKARESLLTAKRLLPGDENVRNAIRDLEALMTKDRENTRSFALKALNQEPTKTEEKSVEADEELKEKMKDLLIPFLESKDYSLSLPGSFTKKEVATMRSLEDEMRFRLIANETTLGPEFKIVKKMPLVEPRAEPEAEENRESGINP